MNCPACSEPLSERGSFCKFCGGQARCLQCKELLEPAAKACVECGTLVGQGNAADGVNGAVHAEPAMPANRNTITYREDRNSRDFQASLSDNSMQSVGTLLAEVFAQRGVGRAIAHGGISSFSKDSPVIDAKGLAAPEASEQPQNETSQEPAPDILLIAKIFRSNGDDLELIERRLKAKSCRDYVRQLTYLFLYAHELHGRHWTPQAAIFAILKDGKVLDANARFWLKGRRHLRVDSEDRFQLIEEGRDEAKQALTAALDSNIQAQWNPDKNTVTKRPRKKKA
jgi:hypothetical protein